MKLKCYLTILLGKTKTWGGLPPKPPIGGRLRPPNPLQKVLSIGAQAFEKNTSIN